MHARERARTHTYTHTHTRTRAHTHAHTRARAPFSWEDMTTWHWACRAQQPSPLREVNPNAIRMKYSHIIDNFGYAATMDVFYALPVDTVEVILGDDNIKVSCYPHFVIWWCNWSRDLACLCCWSPCFPSISSVADHAFKLGTLLFSSKITKTM